jgi:pimeloyl-ACP methyl ester carboxylesterase
MEPNKPISGRPGRRTGNIRAWARCGSFSMVLLTMVVSQGVGAVTDHSAESLYGGPEPRPGPDILYQEPPRAPQLENTGIWKAEPILISGTSAYRKGEFLYQDYLYDDSGADSTVVDPSSTREPAPSGTYTYPTDSAYAGNAADLVELRVTPQGNETAFRATLNTLKDPEKVGLTLAIGESALAQPYPHGANVRGPARLFLTVHGNQAELVDAATGRVLTPAPSVSVDLERRQFEVRVPREAWDPADRVVRLAAGVGLWDNVNDRYLTPQLTASETTPGGAGGMTAPPAFFNVAFRFNETGNWRDGAQAQALAGGDISQFFVQVDFGKLKRGITDNLHGQPKGVPQYGSMNRILASHVETGQGADWSTECGTPDGCVGNLLGQLQPYAIYVPVQQAPTEGYGLTLLLHSLGQNYNQYTGNRHQSQLGERGRGHIVITPAGRGPDGWYVEHAAADAFEVWADVARHYRLDPAMTHITGYSMGGYGTFRFATRFPDLFAKAHTIVGPPAIGIWAPPAEPTGGAQSNTHDLLASVRNIPFLMWAGVPDELVPYSSTSKQASRFDELGYRYRFDSFETADHFALAINDEYGPSAAFLGDATVDRNPQHVTYVVHPAMDFPDIGVVGDHAYWLSDLSVRDPGALEGRGSIDAFSHGFGLGDPVASATQVGVGTLKGGNLGPMPYTSQFKTWGPEPLQPEANRLDITARNVSAVTVHVDRAQLGCSAALNVDTDGPLTVTLAGCGRELHFP